MARYYGTIQGARGPTSRLGHRGLEVTAQSYQGDIVVNFDAKGDEDRVGIYARPHSGGSYVCLYCGPVAALVDTEERQKFLREIARAELARHAGEPA